MNSHKVERTIEGWVMCLWINDGLVNFFEALLVFIYLFLIRIHEKLIVHSDLGKAASWKRLTEKFLNSPLPSIEETKVCMFQFPSPFCTLLDAVGFYCNVMLEISHGLAVEFVVAVHSMDFQSCILQFPYLFWKQFYCPFSVPVCSFSRLKEPIFTAEQMFCGQHCTNAVAEPLSRPFKTVANWAEILALCPNFYLK